MGEKTGDAGSRKVGGVSIRVLNTVMIVLAAIVSLVFLQAVHQTNEAYHRFAQATENYIACEQVASQMKAGSNYLTTQIRQYVITQEDVYLQNYCTEAYETRSREQAVAQLKEYAEGKPAYRYLEQSIERSNELMNTEYYAAKLVKEATGGDPGLAAEALDAIELTPEDQALSKEEKLRHAQDFVFGDAYQENVDAIEGAVAQCKSSLIAEIDQEKDDNAAVIDGLLTTQQLLTWALLAVAVAIIASIVVLILWPIRDYVAHISDNQALPMAGANELRVMAGEYNALYEENLKYSADLRRKAEHDHLTGLYNRDVFERLLHAYHNDPIALLIVDADYFKEVNDTYGHDGGDKVLQKVAGALTHTFRSSDYPCRIGGDEFAVIMTDVTSELTEVVAAKARQLAQIMADVEDGLPAMTLSIGIAFSDGADDSDALFKNADTALYRVKEAGRNGYEFF